jgi:glycosyltransferase involved in cell wall biosynthesis
MRAAIVSTSLAGGAGGAAARLARGLTGAGVDARVVIEDVEGGGGDALVPIAPSLLEKIKRELHNVSPVQRYHERRTSLFSPQRASNRVARTIAALEPDVVNLHWVCAGFVPVDALATLGAPIVWTLHDQWPFTGGCHYSEGCERYAKSCGDCPVLGSDRDDDLSRDVWERKERAWKDVDITVVSPSRWLADCARRSSLFRRRRIEVIPYGIDLDTFDHAPDGKRAARTELGLPTDGALVLFGAWDDTPRKGLDELTKSLRILSESSDVEELQLASFGGGWNFDSLGGLPVHSLGHIDDPARLALAYAAADCFVLPSREDNLPTTVLESMASATPCVAFGVGGVPDMIDDGETGLVVEPGDTGAIARAILRLVNDTGLRGRLGKNARNKAEREYGAALEAGRYAALFDELAPGSSTGATTEPSTTGGPR